MASAGWWCLARRLKPRKSLWAAVGSRVRRMPAHQKPDACNIPETQPGGRKRGMPPSLRNPRTVMRASECDDGTGLLQTAVNNNCEPERWLSLDPAGLQKPAAPPEPEPDPELTPLLYASLASTDISPPRSQTALGQQLVPLLFRPAPQPTPISSILGGACFQFHRPAFAQ